MKTMTAHILRTGGEVEQVDVEGKTFSELRKMIGTDIIEYIYLPDGVAMMVDEEGLLRADPVMNVSATAVSGRPVVGDAMLVNLDDMEAIPYA